MKAYILFLTILLITISTEWIEQAPKIQWEKTFGKSDRDEARAIIQTFDGGYAVCGCTRVSYDKGYDFWVIKLNKYGNIVWEKTFGGYHLNEEAFSIVQTQDSGYVVCGEIENWSERNFDVWIIKLNKKGDIVWNNRIGGYDWEMGASMIQTQDSGFAICGYINPKDTGVSNFWIVKLNSCGNIIWKKIIRGETSQEKATALIQSNDGCYIICGYKEYLGKYANGEFSSADFRLTKLDYKGQLLWNKSYSKSRWDEAYSVIQTKDKGYVMCGVTIQQEKRFQYGDILVIKLDSNGETIWDKTFGGEDREEVGSIIQTRDGGYVICGNTHSYGAGDFDCWIIKLDNGGNSVWDITLGGIHRDEAKSIIPTSDGGLAICGLTKSKGSGNEDFWVIKLK